MTLWQLDAAGTGKLAVTTWCLCCWVSWVVFWELSSVGATLSSTGAGIGQTPTREVFFILFTSISSSPMLWTKNVSSPTVRVLFQDCGNVEASVLAKMRTLCTGTEPSLDGMLCVQLLRTCVIRLIQMTFTFCSLSVHWRLSGRVVGIGMKLLTVAPGGALLDHAVLNTGWWPLLLCFEECVV